MQQFFTFLKAFDWGAIINMPKLLQKNTTWMFTVSKRKTEICKFPLKAYVQKIFSQYAKWVQNVRNFHDLQKLAEFMKNYSKICFSCYKLSKDL